ncbi:predicted protein [Uncinocarpus reesii 1704]|uniref:Uncharacterized protein n=1 Tax=Uncinocarpus reesii (strain UAMH 1704) TaxID=336963 RepID=C4JUU4_UNCRE|nr:uncharacterized protein UREG_04897 [Uncinocarpus reesii 1704]EEP80055.1 predicted protein [Uncinocarpus reesii 1704]
MKLPESANGSNPKLYPKSHYFHTIKADKFSFTPVLRTRYPAGSGEYVELHYADYAVPFPRSKLTVFESLQPRISKENTVKVPVASKRPFCTFYSFLFKQDYPPELVQTTTPYFTPSATQGPPSIRDFRADDPAYLVNDIQMFALGSQMSFAELRNKAFERLYSMGETHNDPMAVFEEIYGDNTIENQGDKDTLRKWARDFLSKQVDESGKTNICILQQSEQWKNRLAEFRKVNELFDVDCSKVEEDLLLNKALKALEKEEKKEKNEDGKRNCEEIGGLSLDELEALHDAFPEIHSRLLDKHEADQKAKEQKEKEKEKEKGKEKDGGKSKENATAKDDKEPSTCNHNCTHCHNASLVSHHGKDVACIAHDPHFWTGCFDSPLFMHPAQSHTTYGHHGAPYYPIPPHC